MKAKGLKIHVEMFTYTTTNNIVWMTAFFHIKLVFGWVCMYNFHIHVFLVNQKYCLLYRQITIKLIVAIHLREYKKIRKNYGALSGTL